MCSFTAPFSFVVMRGDGGKAREWEGVNGGMRDGGVAARE